MDLKIKLGTSEELKGIRCIRADKKILKGEVIEEAPVILIPEGEMEHISKTVLTKYEFFWNNDFEAVTLGYGSLYNHSRTPNVEFEQDYDRKLMIFTALRDIEPGEELFIDYQQGDDPEALPKEYIDYLH